MPIRVKSGPWDATQVAAWLNQAVIPVRLATSGKQFPLVQSAWFQYEDGVLWCATQHDSVLAKRIRRNARIGWEVSGDNPPYRGVRGHGHAELVMDEAERVLRALIDRYGQAGTPLADWLLTRVPTEVAIRIDGLSATSWDFSTRMG